ncbi:MAG: tetratricopeptide repeat protein [Vampirovibrio sp.]|nr:tetratricopeptide repeat protein [Vampirovibrio sp.]
MSQLLQSLEQAYTHHRAGQYQDAENLYRQVLQQDPNQPDALHMMGVLAYQLGQATQAIQLIQQALQFAPNHPEPWMNLGNAYQTAGQLDEAIEAYQKALKLSKENLNVLVNLAEAQYKKEAYEAAAGSLQKALRMNRNHPEALNSLGNVLKAQGNIDEAIRRYEKALAANPQYAQPHYNLGLIYHDAEELDQAVNQYQQALTLSPQFADAHAMLAKALKEQGQYEIAQIHYETALKLAPENPIIHSNYGNLLMKTNRIEEAVQHFETAIQLQPDFADAHHNLATVFHQRQDYEHEQTYYEKALALDPSLKKTRLQLANLLRDQGHLDQAAPHYQQLADQEPGNLLWQMRMEQLIPWIFETSASLEQTAEKLMQVVNQYTRQEMTISLPDILVSDCTPPPQLPYLGGDDKSLKEKYGQFFQKLLSQLTVPLDMDFSQWPERQKPLAGFFVTENHEKAFCYLLAIMIPRFQRIKPCLIMSAVSQQRVLELLPDFPADFLILPPNIDKAIQSVRKYQLDAVFYLEVGTDPLNYILPFYRMAPVQVTSWGYPVTTGIPNLDYFISSELIEPMEGETHYSEQLVRLKTLPIFLKKPKTPTASFSKQTFGFSDTQHLYGCPHELLKLQPAFDEFLAGILRQDPNGLVVLVKSPYEGRNQQLQARFQQAMPDVADRIRLLDRIPHDQFIGLLSVCDVLLDPINFGGGVTTYEALAIGTPIITLPGQYMRGRVTYGCYQKMGILDAVVDSRDAYIERAVELGMDSDIRQALKEKILGRHSVLYEDTTAVTDLETFLVDAVDQVHKNR